METFWTVLIVIIIAGWFINRITKSVQQISGATKGQNRSKCAFCGSRLKSHPNKFGYAEHCPKCGKKQPWAEDAA